MKNIKINDRPQFKDINPAEELKEGFIKRGYHKRPRIITKDSLKSVPLPHHPKKQKPSEGWEDGYDFNIDCFGITAWVSCISYNGIFKLFDQGWFVVNYFGKKIPFFSFPMNRTKKFIARMLEMAEAWVHVFMHWPTCPHCQKKWYWDIIKTNDFEKAYEVFSDRTLFCANESCQSYKVETGFRVTDITVPNKKYQKLFLAPFLQAETTRKKNLAKGKMPIPKRWKRFWNKLGYVFRRKPGVYANDTAKEKELKKLKVSPYANDLQYEHLSGFYPHG